MRQPVPNIQLKLRALREPRSPLASTLVVEEDGQFVVLTLAPLKTARLMGQGPRALWETRVYAFDPQGSVGLGSAPRYAALSASQGEALDRHEALVLRLQVGTFETETAREVLAPIRPLMRRGAEEFSTGNPQATVSAFDQVIRVAGRMDPLHHFLHLYQEAFLMRALALECMDRDAAKAAYRDFIYLCAGLPSRHRDTFRAVARAREAIERLTPIPHEGSTRRRVQAGEHRSARPR